VRESLGSAKPKGEMKVKATHLCWCLGVMVVPTRAARNPGASRSL